MKHIRKGKGTSKPVNTVKRGPGRKMAELPSKRLQRLKSRVANSYARAAGAKRQARRDSR